MRAWPLLLAAALLPAIALTRVSAPSLTLARNTWLWGLWVTAALTVGVLEPWLGVIGVYWAVWWRASGDWPLTWVGIGATWFLARQIPPELADWLPLAWGVAASVASVVMVQQWHRGDPAQPRAWFGMRSVAGAFLALVLAGLPLWAWPLPLIGLWLSGPSLLALVALLGGGIYRWQPSWGALGGLGAAIGLVAMVWYARPVVLGRVATEWLPRGDTLDTLWTRVEMTRWACRSLTLWGHGPGAIVTLHNRAYLRFQLRESMGTLHNEPLQAAVEYGMVGVLALGLFCWRVVPGLTVGDPWSAMVVTGGLLACGTMALRAAPIGVIWLIACARVAP